MNFLSKDEVGKLPVCAHCGGKTLCLRAPPGIVNGAQVYGSCPGCLNAAGVNVLELIKYNNELVVKKYVPMFPHNFMCAACKGTGYFVVSKSGQAADVDVTPKR